MAKSPTEIVNLALGKLGAKTIHDINDSVKGARKGKLFYDQARDETLARTRWDFALQRNQPPELASKPLFGWSYQHGLPTDFIRLAEVNGKDVWASATHVDWFSLEAGEEPKPGESSGFGRKILSNMQTIYIRYVQRITDTTRYSPLFTNAMATLLASKMARSITGSSRLEGRLLQVFDEMDLPDAMQVNGAQVQGGENPPIIHALQNSFLVRSRGLSSSDVGAQLPGSISPFGIPGIDE